MGELKQKFISLNQVASDNQLHKALGLKSEGISPKSQQGMALKNTFFGKRILVTGGGGSIGSELIRRLAFYQPQSIAIFDINENNSYLLYCELKQKFESLNIKIYIGSVRDKSRVHEVFMQEKPQIVFHTAAHKHLPLMQGCPKEAVKNNVFGTKTVIDACEKYEVERFLLVSTDKAVNPTSVMGKSKRVCEMLMQQRAKNSNVIMCAVRFGNVFASDGSVVPIMLNQMMRGEPITVTSPDMQRYFMTITNACDLLLVALSNAQKGCIYLLDMGKPIKIQTLVNALSQRYLVGEPKVVYIGVRDGEKITEECSYKSEKCLPLTEQISLLKPMRFNSRKLSSYLNLLKKQIKLGANSSEVEEVLNQIISLC